MRDEGPPELRLVGSDALRTQIQCVFSGTSSFRWPDLQSGPPVQVCNIFECSMLVDSVVILKVFCLFVLISTSYTAGFVIPLDVQIVKQRH